MDPIQKLQQWILESQNTVFFGGAGVSTESGIPDFRGEDGLYRQKYSYPPETILSHDFFFHHMDVFYQFYREKMLVINAVPNDAHKKLAEMEHAGQLKAVITQNIDGLHQKAGSKYVLELHGSIYRNHCLSCNRSFTAEEIIAKEGIPRCSCGGIIKPDVVLYQESLDETVLENSVHAIEQAELLLVGGTSLSVYPAAGLIRYYKGSRLVLMNKTTTPYDAQADLLLKGKIGEIFHLISVPKGELH